MSHSDSKEVVIIFFFFMLGFDLRERSTSGPGPEQSLVAGGCTRQSPPRPPPPGPGGSSANGKEKHKHGRQELRNPKQNLHHHLL